MIKFNGMNCWSPLAPTAYGIQAEPTIYASPVGEVIYKALVKPDVGVNLWNLVWLLHPEVDQILPIAKTGSFVKMQALEKSFPTVFEYGYAEHLILVGLNEVELQGPPLIFLRKVAEGTALLPTTTALTDMQARALTVKL